MNSPRATSPYYESNPFDFAPRNEEIRESIAAALNRDPQLRNRNISADFSQGVLTLRGHVPSYYLKQLAQSYVHRIAGVQTVVNRIEVVDRPYHPH